MAPRLHSGLLRPRCVGALRHRVACFSAWDAAAAESGVERLERRGFVQLEGADTLPFLQGLTTNDTRLLEAGDTLCQYTGILHHKGAPFHWLVTCSREKLYCATA